MVTNQLIGRGISHAAVLDAMRKVERHLFVPSELANRAYHDSPLPIGYGQTISQPYIVARMTELLLNALNNANSVLEIGTGSGYQTAILAQLFSKVFSVERIKSLQFQAKRRMNQLNLHNISMKHGDGWKGWSSKGPFDAIIVTAAASSLPQALTDQLNEGGRLIIPVGNDAQTLLCIDRRDGELVTEEVESVRFVPLVAGDIV